MNSDDLTRYIQKRFPEALVIKSKILSVGVRLQQWYMQSPLVFLFLMF